MTRFDTVVTAAIEPQDTLLASCLGLIAQGRPGLQGNSCRFDQGCAVGQLLTSEERLTADEDASVETWRRLEARGHNRALLTDLQHAHDHATADIWVRYHEVTPSTFFPRWLKLLQRTISLWDPVHGLDFEPVLVAAREAGWEVEP